MFDPEKQSIMRYGKLILGGIVITAVLAAYALRSNDRTENSAADE